MRKQYGFVSSSNENYSAVRCPLYFVPYLFQLSLKGYNSHTLGSGFLRSECLGFKVKGEHILGLL